MLEIEVRMETGKSPEGIPERCWMVQHLEEWGELGEWDK